MDRSGVNQGGIIAQNIVIMRKKMCNDSSPIRPAPNRFALKEFGGPLTIEEFRSLGDPTGKFITLPDEAHKCHAIIRAKYETSTKSAYTAETKFQDIQNSSINVESLKLKRSKPLKRDENNLEMSMGIIRKVK